MGESLVAMVVFGPVKIDATKEQIQHAEARIHRLVDLAKRCQELLKQNTKEAADEEEEALKELTKLMPDSWNDFDDAIKRLAEEVVPKEAVQSFIDTWNYGTDDSVWRTDPRDEERKVFIVGGGSWGDSPDGEGYKAMDLAEKLGLLEVFGCE